MVVELLEEIEVSKAQVFSRNSRSVKTSKVLLVLKKIIVRVICRHLRAMDYGVFLATFLDVLEDTGSAMPSEKPHQTVFIDFSLSVKRFPHIRRDDLMHSFPTQSSQHKRLHA